MTMGHDSREDKTLKRLRHFMAIGVALSAEKNHNRLLETILLEAKDIAQADGGTIYLRTSDDHLEFAIMRNDTLGTALGGTTGKPINLPRLPLYDVATGKPNHHNVATHVALEGKAFNIPDAYDAEGFDFSGTRKFDERNKYRSKSFLTLPMKNNKNDIIGVLQLINSKDSATGQVVAFSQEAQELCEALASQAAVALDNQMLIEAQKNLLDAFIRLIADSIDRKSPYTGGHCKRVPTLTEMIARAACEAKHDLFSNFDLTEEQWYELHIAAWLHDCGKIVTPVHVMDKATKLETICDRVHEIRSRFEVLKRDAEIRYLRARLGGRMDEEQLENEYREEVRELDDELKFIEHINIGGEFLDDAKIERLRSIAKRKWRPAADEQDLLTADEVDNLAIRRGTLTDPERKIINDHIVHTIEMLEKLPFPKHLERVPEYAGGHHEKMDGTGYPKGLKRDQMSIPARIMAVADVFEALTAVDRPYKKGKTLSESMKIMGFMKADNHLDPDIFDLFVRGGVYKEYAKKFMQPELIDEVDEEALLRIKPKPPAPPKADAGAKPGEPRKPDAPRAGA